MYQTILLALYTLCNIACDVAGTNPSAHHSRGMGSQAAIAKEPSELCLFNNERWLLSNMIY